MGSYQYDNNGNMTCRVENGATYKQVYNAENRLSGVSKMNGDCATGTIVESWLFAYDGDGTRVTQAYTNVGTGSTLTTLYFMGGAYEKTVETSAVKKYYAIAGMTVAMRQDTGALVYLLTDHLGSVVGVTDSSGTLISQQRYLPFGQVRTDVGSISQTDFGYTGQRALSMGLMDYKARMYDPYITHFSQPDSIIPDPSNPQSFNRFSYALNNPVRYTDPSGHQSCVGANWDDGPQCFVDGKPKNIRIDWDPAFGKNVSEKDKRAAIKAYLNFLSDPLQFAEYYVNPASASQDYDALEIFAQYTSLHTTADNMILDVVAKTFGMDAVEALDNARLHNVEASLSKNSSILHAGEALFSVVFPTAPGQLMHIFRNAEGHFAEDTAMNRALLVDTVQDQYFVEVDPQGNSIYARVLNDSTEVWVEVRNGVIRNGGLNQVPIWKK